MRQTDHPQQGPDRKARGGRRRQREGQAHRAGADAYLLDARDALRRHATHQRGQRARHPDAQRPRSERQHERLGPEEARHATPARAQRGANRQVAHPRLGTRDAHAGHVGHRNGHEQTGGAQQHEEHRSHPAHRLLPELHGAEDEARIPAAEPFDEPIQGTVQARSQGLDRGAGGEAGHHAQLRRAGHRRHERHPDVGPGGEAECGRHVLGAGEAKPSGITPATSYGSSLSTRVEPTTRDRRPACRSRAARRSRRSSRRPGQPSSKPGAEQRVHPGHVETARAWRTGRPGAGRRRGR